MRRTFLTTILLLIAFTCAYSTYMQPSGSFSMYADASNYYDQAVINVTGANYIRVKIRLEALSSEVPGDYSYTYLDILDGNYNSEYMETYSYEGSTQYAVYEATYYMKNNISIDLYCDASYWGVGVAYIEYETSPTGEASLPTSSNWKFATKDGKIYLGKVAASPSIIDPVTAFSFSNTTTGNSLNIDSKNWIQTQNNAMQLRTEFGLLELNNHGKFSVGGATGRAGELYDVQFEIAGIPNEYANLSGTKLLIKNYLSVYSTTNLKTTYPIKIVDSNNNTDFYIVNKNYQRAETQMYFSGKVGIGTGSPKAFLDVARALDGGKFGTILGRLSEGNGTGNGTLLGVRGYGTQPANAKSFAIEHLFYGELNSSINFFRGSNANDGFITFNTFENNESKARLVIQNNGNVGIGTTTVPSAYKLAVNGTIGAGEIIIESPSTWADYVFNDDYELRSLVDLEAFVKANKHLPDIPSENEVKSSGINVAEMNKLLLQKIEELTLYMIEQQKSIQQQQAQIDALRSAVEATKQ